MQKALCTTLLAAGMASADVLTIEVDGIADPAFGCPALGRLNGCTVDNNSNNNNVYPCH